MLFIPIHFGGQGPHSVVLLFLLIQPPKLVSGMSKDPEKMMVRMNDGQFPSDDGQFPLYIQLEFFFFLTHR